MISHLPFLIAINQPLPHLSALQKFVIEKGWRAAGYVPENDADLIVVNSDADDTWKPVTIEQIRELPAKLSMQRVSPRQRIVIIQALNLSNQTCQHALLKILEELPAETIMLVTTTHLQTILPTVASRCVTVKLEGEASEATSADGQQFLADLRAATQPSAKPADIFAFSERWKDRAETLQALKGSTAVLQTELEMAPSIMLVKTLAAVQDTYWALQANTNVRLQLEQLAKGLGGKAR